MERDPDRAGFQHCSGWRVNTSERCYERGSERRLMRIYPGPDGFVVSAFGVRSEEIYPSFSAAEAIALREGCEPEGAARVQADAAEIKRQRRNARRAAR